MTTSRYSAHTDHRNPNRIVLVDSLSENHAVVDLPAAFGDALIEQAQAFLDAGVARYGSVDAFDKACRWYLDITKAA